MKTRNDGVHWRAPEAQVRQEAEQAELGDKKPELGDQLVLES